MMDVLTAENQQLSSNGGLHFMAKNEASIWSISSVILYQAGILLPKYHALLDYLNRDECIVVSEQRGLCQQIVCLELFANYFYSIYLVSLRGALKSSNAREQKAHLKYVNAYIIEGFKALWGFKKHKKSLWGRLLQTYSQAKNTDKFDILLDSVTSDLNVYENDAITDKDERCLAMHYQIDKNGSPQELLKLDEITIDKELARYEQFSSIFHKIISCITEMCNHYLFEPYRTELQKIEPILPELNSLDQYLWKDYVDKINLAMDKNIASQSKAFDSYKEQLYKYPKIFKDIKDKYNIDVSDCQEIVSLAEIMLALSYFSLDLCSSLKVYFNASLPMERNIALSRMNIVCHSFIDRVYGYTDHKSSYWERYITKPYIGKELPEEMRVIKRTLDLVISSNVYSSEKRATFVHLKKDNFLSAIEYLYKSNSIVEISNTKKMIELIPKVQKTIVDGLKQIDNNIKQRNARKYSWIDDCLNKMAPYKNLPNVNRICESLQKLKKGDFFEAMELLKETDRI